MLHRLNLEQSANLKPNSLKRFICQRHGVKLADCQNNGFRDKAGQHWPQLAIRLSKLSKSLKQSKVSRLQHRNVGFQDCRVIWPTKMVGSISNPSLLKSLNPLSKLLKRLNNPRIQRFVKRCDYPDNYVVVRVGSIIQLILLFAAVAQDYRLCWLQNRIGAIHQRQLICRLSSL